MSNTKKEQHDCTECFRFGKMNDRNVCSGFGYIDDNLKTCSAFIPKEDSTKRDIPFPDDSSTGEPIDINKQFAKIDKMIKAPTGKSVPIENLLDRLEHLEEENAKLRKELDDLKIIATMNLNTTIRAIPIFTQYYRHEVVPPKTQDSWRKGILTWAKTMGLPVPMKFEIGVPEGVIPVPCEIDDEGSYSNESTSEKSQD